MMKTAFISLATAALLVTSAIGQSLQINTPSNVVQCLPIQLTWSGGTPPYFLSILPGSQPSAPALEDLGQQTGTSLTWVANIAAGTSIGLTLRDSTGAVAQSAPFSINPGSDSSCIGKTSSTSGSTSATGSTGGTTVSTSTASTPAATTTTPAATITSATTSKASTTTSPATKASSTGSTTSSATSSPNAGPTQAASFGVAGMVGAAVIALLA